MEIPFKNLFSKLAPKKSLKSSGEHNPFRDWNFMLIIFVLGLIAVFISSFFIHQSFSTSKNESNREFIAKTFNEEQMKQVLVLFEEKAVLFEEAKNTTPLLTDPSI